jgi:hypothetical protein
MLFEFAPLYRLLFAIALPELHQLGAKAVVNLSVSVPELPFGLVLSSRFEVEEDVVLAGRAIPRLVSHYFISLGTTSYLESRSSILAYVGSFNVSCLRTSLWARSFALQTGVSQVLFPDAP